MFSLGAKRRGRIDLASAMADDLTPVRKRVEAQIATMPVAAAVIVTRGPAHHRRHGCGGQAAGGRDGYRRPIFRPPLVVRTRTIGPPEPSCVEMPRRDDSSPWMVIGMSLRKPPFTVRVSSWAL